MIEYDYKGYERMHDFFNLVVQKDLGIKTPPETMNAWSALARTIKVTDDALDVAGRDRYDEITDNSLTFLDGDVAVGVETPALEKHLTQLQGELAQLTEERQETFMTDLRRLMSVDRALKSADTQPDFTKLSLLKGQLTSRLFLDMVPDSVREHPKYNHFQRQMKLVGRGGSMFDMFIDQGSDYRMGHVSLPPTIRNRFKVFVSGLPTAVEVFKGVGKKLVPELIFVGIMTKVHAKDDLA